MSYKSNVSWIKEKGKMGRGNRALCATILLGLAVLLGMSLATLPLQAQDQEQGTYPPPADPQPQGAPAAAAYPQVPPTLTVPAGTVIAVRVSEYLSSDQNHAGDMFGVTLDQPLIVDGWVVARRGQAAYGRVAVAQKSKAGGGSSRLGVELSELTVVDGQQVPVQTQFSQASGGGPNNGQNVATVGVTTGIGAAIGAAANGGEGAGIGAGIGAAAGMLGVLLTPGKPTVLPPETLLNFRLTAPLTVSTVRSQVAFQPVTQQDYNNQNYDRYRGPASYGPQRVVTPPPPPYYYYGGPYYGYPYYGGYYGWGYYDRPFFGFYGGPSLVFRFGHDGHEGFHEGRGGRGGHR
jgi:hypothetical protein